MVDFALLLQGMDSISGPELKSWGAKKKKNQPTLCVSSTHLWQKGFKILPLIRGSALGNDYILKRKTTAQTFEEQNG